MFPNSFNFLSSVFKTLAGVLRVEIFPYVQYEKFIQEEGFHYGLQKSKLHKIFWYNEERN